MHGTYVYGCRRQPIGLHSGNAVAPLVGLYVSLLRVALAYSRKMSKCMRSHRAVVRISPVACIHTLFNHGSPYATRRCPAVKQRHCHMQYSSGRPRSLALQLQSAAKPDWQLAQLE